jgi:hypothetical protein
VRNTNEQDRLKTKFFTKVHWARLSREAPALEEHMFGHKLLVIKQRQKSDSSFDLQPTCSGS